LEPLVFNVHEPESQVIIGLCPRSHALKSTYYIYLYVVGSVCSRNVEFVSSVNCTVQEKY